MLHGILQWGINFSLHSPFAVAEIHRTQGKGDSNGRELAVDKLTQEKYTNYFTMVDSEGNTLNTASSSSENLTFNQERPCLVEY